MKPLVRHCRFALLSLFTLVALSACNRPLIRTPSPPTAVPTAPPPAPAPSPAATAPAPATVTALPAPPAPAPAATLPAAPQATVLVTVPALVVDDLSKVKATSKLVVGTSADYPPFTYYTSQYKLDGFDPALITELGRRLGLRVEVSDFALEGLVTTLPLGQTDVVIAALVPTTERRQQADFTNAYYIGTDAILADKASQVTKLGALTELAAKRVGVQRGSSYSRLLKRTLVDTSLSDPANIVEYLNTSAAIDDLEAGKIDFVMVSSLPAHVFSQTRHVKVVGEGFNPQRFAIGVRKGSNLLQALNDALLQAQNDGTVQKLIAQYLNQQSTPGPIPTPTPIPAPTAGPVRTATPAACVDGMSLVTDLTFADHNMASPASVLPGSGFTKSWRFQNTGTCIWAADYSLRFVFGSGAGADMGGHTVALGQSVVNSQTMDVSVNLIAPSTPGLYQGFWQMYNSFGVPFGQRVSVGILVVSGPTTVPSAPTAVPTPGPKGLILTFAVDQPYIQQGQGVTFRWTTQNASAVYFYPQGTAYTCCARQASGAETAFPTTSGIWELRVENASGAVEIRQLAVVIYGTLTATPTQIINDSSSGPTDISYFTAIPTGNGCVSLQWSIQGQLSSVSMQRDNQPLGMPQTPQGVISDCPGVSTRVYTLTASNATGNPTSISRTVSVN